MENETFWASSINVEATSEAKNILRKSAADLGNLTKNIVEATVNTTIRVDQNADGFMDPPVYTHCFDIIAPLLGYQQFTLFCVDQTVGLEYPLSIFSNYWEKKEQCNCNSVDDLKKCLKEILSSEKTAQLINSIIAESK